MFWPLFIIFRLFFWLIFSVLRILVRAIAHVFTASTTRPRGAMPTPPPPRPAGIGMRRF